jgi:hypothetical protein
MAQKDYRTLSFPALDVPEATMSRSRSRKTYAKDIMGGSLKGVTELLFGGDASVRIDNANRRIIINDGDNDRVLLGYDAGGF